MPKPTAVAIGIDLAWSSRNASGFAVAAIFEDRIENRELDLLSTNTALVKCVSGYIHSDLPTTIAIDAPTVIPHHDKMRECEKLLHRDEHLRKAHACPYPGTRTRLGAYNGGRPRGEELVAELAEQFGVQEVGCPPPSHNGRYAMEVFPAAAMARLFDLEAPLPYKKKKGRSWEQCRKGLTTYIEHLRALRAPALILPDSIEVNGEKGKAFKALEDRVDAALCAYVAALAWLGRTECIGTAEMGYIVLPTSGAGALPPHQ